MLTWPLAICLFVVDVGPAANQTPGEEPPHQIVIVTASQSEEPLLDSASYAGVVTREDLENRPAVVLDDYLRRVPGFSLFRRSSSWTAHPTTQGVSLRGVGPSGTSRSLVLFDSLPVNDPFGGWVYWNRFPLLLLEQVEVVRGAQSALYGNQSMGGTVQILSRRPSEPSFEMRGVLGNRGTRDLEALVGARQGDWSYLAAGRTFRTDGFYVVAEEERGDVDRPAYSEFESFFGRFEYKKAFFGFNYYQERRGNGTELQTNNSRLALLEGGLSGSDWRVRFFGESNLLESRFSRILPDRSQEFLTADQSFPAAGLGSSFLWQPRGAIQVGADWRLVSWDGNRQNLAGVFVQDVLALGNRLDWLWGVRLDGWQNESLQAALNLRTGFVFRARPELILRGSAYRGFRAPTLNELYRPFRAGNVETLPNSSLTEERVWGFEGGGDWLPADGVMFRLNGFWNRLEDAVGNVTISTSPDLILRQRQNQGEAAIQGVEAEFGWRRGSWGLNLSYLYSFTRLAETDRWLPQVPRHQAAGGISYLGPLRFFGDVRWVGLQYDDDLNEWPLGGYIVVDAQVSRPLKDSLELFLSVQNLLDRRFSVARTPIDRLGEPRLFQAGVRFRWGG